MEPALLQKTLSSTGLLLDMVGAFLLAVDFWRKFKGTKATVGKSWSTISDPPQETADFKKHIKFNTNIAFAGLLFLMAGFLLQLLAGLCT